MAFVSFRKVLAGMNVHPAEFDGLKQEYNVKGYPTFCFFEWVGPSHPSHFRRSRHFQSARHQSGATSNGARTPAGGRLAARCGGLRGLELPGRKFLTPFEKVHSCSCAKILPRLPFPVVCVFHFSGREARTVPSIIKLQQAIRAFAETTKKKNTVNKIIVRQTISEQKKKWARPTGRAEFPKGNFTSFLKLHRELLWRSEEVKGRQQSRQFWVASNWRGIKASKQRKQIEC